MARRNQFRFFLRRLLFLPFFLCLLQRSKVAATNSSSRNGFEMCNADLERKFMEDGDRCPYSGLVPVKGSCTAYIPCITFGGDLTKPVKRAECTSGMTFDIVYRRCRPFKTLPYQCLQQQCYPAETLSEDQSPPPTASEEDDSKQSTNTTTTDTGIGITDDVDEITIDVQETKNSTFSDESVGMHPNTNNSHPIIISSAVADRFNFKFIGLYFLVLKVPFIFIDA